MSAYTAATNVVPLRIHPPGDTPLIDVIRRAQRTGCKLVSNGFQIYVTPILLPGEREVGVRIEEAA